MVLIIWILNLISVILMIPFLTLLERKLLSYIQLRKGPKKVSILGILQPVADGVKLFVKDSGSITPSKSLFFWFSGLFNFFLMWVLFLVYQSCFPVYSSKYSLVVYLCISSLLVYTILTSGWSSNSKFAFLGSLRGAAQMISYEVILLTLLFFPCVASGSYSFYKNIYSYNLLYVFLLIIFIFWMIAIVAETNRTPFDFAEGESELVSGFNTEYSGMVFALLFLGEYGNIMFVSYLTGVLFFYKFKVWLVMKSMIFLFFIFRGTFPRFRYDLLMYLGWKIILPVLLVFFLIIFIF